MKWQIAWIALIAACVLVFGWLIYAYFADLVVARPTTEGVEIIAQGHHLLEPLWPLIAAGVLGSAIPAWTFIVWIFVQLREEDHNATYQRLETALTALQEANRQIACARAQAKAVTHDQNRERRLSQREAAIAQAERQVQQRQRQAEQAQQEAAHQIEAAQARAEAAELRAKRATNAFQRVKRKSLSKHPAQAKPPSANRVG